VFFRRNLLSRTDTGESRVSDIRVRPAVKDLQGNWVDSLSFRLATRNKDTEKWEIVEQYQVRFQRPPYGDSPAGSSIIDYLKARQANTPTLVYSYQAWREPRWVWAISLGGSVLLIGVIWPLVIRLMVRLGLGQPERAIEKGYDLSKVSSRSAAPAIVAAPVADRSELDALNAKLEENVAGMLIAEKPADVDDESPEAEVIRKLDAQPAEPPAPAAPAQDDQDYRGEYYPVAKPK